MLNYKIEPRTIIMDKRNDIDDLPDPVKGWDVKNVLEIAKKIDNKDAYILNTGVYNDYSLIYLYNLGFRNLIGIDLNKEVMKQKGYTKVKYMVGDMYNTHFPSHMFDFIISISAVEHSNGIEDFKRFVNEAKRLLRPGGILYVSTDYNETKISTRNIFAFGLPWNIFSRDEIKEILTYMDKVGFDVDFNIPSQQSKLVKWNNREYTFLAIIARLRDNVPDNMERKVDGVSIFIDTLGYNEGIAEYSKLLERHMKRYGLDVVFNERRKGYPTIYEYHPGISAKNLNPEHDILDNHGNSGPTSKYIIVHDNRLKYTDNYYVIPHLEYDNPCDVKWEPEEDLICSFGFGFKFKRFDKVIKFAKKKKMKWKIFVSANQVSKEFVAPRDSEIGWWDYCELLKKLSKCRLIVFAYKSEKKLDQVSGAMRLPSALGIPTVSITDSLRAWEAQINVVNEKITKEELLKLQPSNIFRSSGMYFALFNEVSR